MPHCTKCTKRASFGIKGQKPSSCKLHKTENMSDLVTKKCSYSGCTTSASFGYKNGVREKCSLHVINNMIDLSSKICITIDCTTSATFGFQGQKPESCKTHRTEYMMDLKHRKCKYKNCKTIPCYGIFGGPIEFCSTHRLKDMTDLVNKRCIKEDCDIIASYGYYKKSIDFCFNHKLSLMIDLKGKKCTSCGLFRVEKKHNYLCGYCRPFSKIKSKEMIVKNLLLDNGFVFTCDKQISNDYCFKYRPDFLFKSTSYYIILECDENAHNSYDKDCEMVRMNNISMSLDLPVKFIRYNPDLKGVKTKNKHEALIDVLNTYLNLDVLDDISPLYMFYT
jgi:hypothetical protein